jgi:hypothetical protein
VDANAEREMPADEMAIATRISPGILKRDVFDMLLIRLIAVENVSILHKNHYHYAPL